ncbi:MAG: NUDIX domain-containing protein [Patescibacteria group bacterium]|mgnify:CR=1 FL=1
MKKYFELTPAAYVVFRKNEEILLVRRANTGYFDGSYSLPAGHFDGGESATSVAIREAKEEVGVDINSKDLRLVHTSHRASNIPVKHERIDLFFEAKKWEGELTNKEPRKCDELRWVKIDQLPPKMVPEVKQALQKIAAGEIYSELNLR